MKSDRLPKDEFCTRFKARMIAVAGENFSDGTPIADYADTTAPTYWEDQHKDGDSPEECADGDISCWGE